MIGMIFLMSGCADKNAHLKNTGFLNSYEELESGDSFSASKMANNADIASYNKLYIAPIKVVFGTLENRESVEQKKLSNEISEYVKAGYIREIKKSKKYKIVETADADTLVLESAISAVETHLDDKKWNQFSPIAMDITVTSYNSYADGNVRILGEKRISVGESSTPLFESKNIMKDEKISLQGDTLEFEDVKEALDGWIEHVKSYFAY